MQPNIDIISVTFNNLKELQRTYYSLCNQSDRQFRWIVIDGASEDGTRQWLEKLSPPFPWYYLSEPDTGIYSAMNKGRKYVMPEGYTLYMNSGDELYDHDVIRQLRGALTTNSGSIQSAPLLVYGDAVNISPDGKAYHNHSRSPSHSIKGMVTSHQAMFFNNQLLRLVGYDEYYRLSGDYDLMCKFVESSYLFNLPPLRLPIKVCKFYLDGVSVTQRQKALKEDYCIRRHVMKASIFTAGALYCAHQLHFLLKKYLPNLIFLLRSR